MENTTTPVTENIQQPVVTEPTQTQPIVAEENKAIETTQDIQQPSEGNDAPPSGDQGTQPQGDSQQIQVPQEDVEKLKSKLQEYELDQQEINQLKERLGVDNVDYGTREIATTLDMINNQAQQEYIRLCSKYGVDSRPDRLDSSAAELQSRDPKAFYEFQMALDRLAITRNSRVAEVQNYAATREVNKFYTDNQAILDASPSITGILRDYISSTPRDQVSREGMDYYLGKAREIYTEAYYAGLQAAQKANAVAPEKLLNNSSMGSQQTSYPMGSSTFTKEQVANMSLEEFAKHEKEITRQMTAGLIK